MVTPGTETGYWKARKRPFFALLSGVRLMMLSPSTSTSPFVTLYFGCPRSVFASVLLPEPFGPISACISPWFMVRSTPFSISVPSTDACRSRISNFDIWC